MTRTVHAIRHVVFEDLDGFESVLGRRGFALRYFEAGRDDLTAAGAGDPDLLVVLGGPMGVYEADRHPFLTQEIRVAADRLRADRPLLGICLGSQIMASALGARVYPMGAREIGWSPLALTEEGEGSPLRHLAAGGVRVLHWHGDTFDLPQGAVRLASTPVCRNQAFAFGERALGLQFHAETTAAGLERWFAGHAGATPGLDVPALRAETARSSPAMERQGVRFFEEWLDAVLPA